MRRVIHHTVAQTYEYLYVDRLDEFAALLAHHYAEARDDTKSTEYAIRAGNLALHANAQPEARLHYAQALDALSRLPDDDQNRRWRLDALLNQMWVATFSEPPAVQLERLDEAEALARSLPETDSAVQRQVAQIYHFKGFMHLITNRPREALHYFNAARTLSQTLGDERVQAIATASIGLQLSFQGRFSAAEPFIRDDIDLMRRAGVPLDQVSAVSTLGWIVAAQGNYAAGQAEAEQGILLAQQAHNPSAIEVGYSLLAEIYWMGRDIPHMLEASRACLAMAEANHDIVWMNIGYYYVAWAQSYLGQHEEALANRTRAGYWRDPEGPVVSTRLVDRRRGRDRME